MSAVRHGKIERTILAEVAEAAKPRYGEAGSVLITSSELVRDVYNPYPTTGTSTWDECQRLHAWEPTLAQRKAVARAMHSFVGKHQQYALTGGQGRRDLYLYDTADPVSAMWAKLNVERKRRSGPIPRMAARAAVEALAEAPER